MSTSTLSIRLEHICKSIAEHSAAAGVKPEAVKIVAVTKYATPEQMAAAFDAGITNFGENKVQDALEHIEAFQKLRPAANINWHFIGHLQSNKVGKAIGNFSLIHSVDSVKIGQKISESNRVVEESQPVLLQVNVSGEESKGGFAPKEVEAAIAELKDLPGIEIKGLMTMAPLATDLHDNPHAAPVMEAEGVFARLHDLRESLKRSTGMELPELSMGMSKDYVPALKNGATIIRVGQFLFGSP